MEYRLHGFPTLERFISVKMCHIKAFVWRRTMFYQWKIHIPSSSILKWWRCGICGIRDVCICEHSAIIWCNTCEYHDAVIIHSVQRPEKYKKCLPSQVAHQSYIFPLRLASYELRARKWRWDCNGTHFSKNFSSPRPSRKLHSHRWIRDTFSITLKFRVYAGHIR